MKRLKRRWVFAETEPVQCSVELEENEDIIICSS